MTWLPQDVQSAATGLLTALLAVVLVTSEYLNAEFKARQGLDKLKRLWRIPLVHAEWSFSVIALWFIGATSVASVLE